MYSIASIVVFELGVRIHPIQAPPTGIFGFLFLAKVAHLLVLKLPIFSVVRRVGFWFATDEKALKYGALAAMAHAAIRIAADPSVLQFAAVWISLVLSFISPFLRCGYARSTRYFLSATRARMIRTWPIRFEQEIGTAKLRFVSYRIHVDGCASIYFGCVVRPAYSIGFGRRPPDLFAMAFLRAFNPAPALALLPGAIWVPDEIASNEPSNAAEV
jgi:hypothetical protein